MKVQCESCGVKLSLPDEKMTPGSEFTFSCPKCNHKNTVRAPLSQSAPAPAKPEPPAKKAESTPGYDFEEDAALLEEFFEEGARPALVCFDEGPLRDKVVATLKKLGYIPVIPTSTRDALKRIQVTRFYMVLLHEIYDGQTRDRNALLRLLQPMEMSTRRRMWVALFGEDLQTFDYITAYALSMNAVINTGDIDRLEKVIERGVAEYRRFYKVYFEVMREMGKI